MPPCPFCRQPAAKRDGHDAAGRQRYACRACGHDFTEHSASAFAGYRWPAEVILLAVRWSLSHPLSATSVMELLAERGIDVSKRTVLRWVQTLTLSPNTHARASRVVQREVRVVARGTSSSQAMRRRTLTA